MTRYFREHPFLRDGILSIVLVFGWSAAMTGLSRFSGSIIYELFWEILDSINKPAKNTVVGLLNFAFASPLPGLVSADGQFTRSGQVLAVSFAILFLVGYWFLLGGLVCWLWRFARSRIQQAFRRQGA